MGQGKPRRRRPSSQITLRRSGADQAWTLVHPRCVRERFDDIDEVRRIIDAGEYDIAIDELRWLVADCRDFIEAHQLLGDLARIVDKDPTLARGHYGFAYQLGLQPLRKVRFPTPLPYRLPANRAFFEAGLGLARCLHDLDLPELAVEVVEQLLHLDPTDPLELKRLLDDWSSGGLPIVEL